MRKRKGALTAGGQPGRKGLQPINLSKEECERVGKGQDVHLGGSCVCRQLSPSWTLGTKPGGGAGRKTTAAGASVLSCWPGTLVLPCLPNSQCLEGQVVLLVSPASCAQGLGCDLRTAGRVRLEGRGTLTVQAEPGWRHWEAEAASDSSCTGWKNSLSIYLASHTCPGGENSPVLAGGGGVQHHVLVCPCPPRLLMFQAHGTWGGGHWRFCGTDSGNCRESGCLKIQYGIHVWEVGDSCSDLQLVLKSSQKHMKEDVLGMRVQNRINRPLPVISTCQGISQL